MSMLQRRRKDETPEVSLTQVPQELYDAVNKENELTIMEEIVLLGIKDSEVLIQ